MVKSTVKFLFTFLIFFCSRQDIFSQKKIYDLVKDFGAKADDKTDNYEVFTKAALKLSGTEGCTLIIPKGKYYIAAYKIVGGPQKNGITDITFKNCNGLTIQGNNSTVRVNGKFTRRGDYVLPNLPYHYSFSNTVSPFAFTNCKNLILKDVTLYGEADKMKREEGVVENPNHGVTVIDGNESDISSKILFQHITVHHFAADGIMINSNGSNLSVIGCKSYCNGRQGLSIVKGRDILCYNSQFDSTGFTGGTYGWHMPGAGIDVENEFGPGKLNNVKIIKCSMRANKGFQIVTTMPGENVLVDSCFIADLNAGFSSGVNGVGIYSYSSTLSNSIIFGTIQVDLADQIYTGEKIQTIKNNIIYSGHRAIICSDFQRPVTVENNILVMLPHPDITYFPYIQDVNARFNYNIIVVHPDRVDTLPNQVGSLVQYVKENNNNCWLLNKNNFTAAKKKSHFFYPAFDNNKILTTQLFPDNNVSRMIDYAPIKRLDEKQIDKILSAGLFSAFKQAGFDKKYLSQANEVQQYVKTIFASSK